MENKKFCIYVHNNKINNKKYIGQTSNPQQRWFPANYKGCTKFYNAIKKYGWENFQHIILIDNLTLEEANQKEQQLIKQYNTIENGYNLKTGGLNNLYSKQSRQKMSNSNNAKPIICIETKKVYKNAMEVQRQLGFKETNIISCCQHHLHTAYNFHWEYYDSSFDYNNYKPITKDKRKKAVFCKELKRVFSSASEASRELNISRPSISKCCSKKDSLKTAGGYHWQYYQEET